MKKKRGSGTSGSHLFAGGVCSIRSCASGRDSDPDRDFVPGIPRGLLFAYCTERQRELWSCPMRNCRWN